MLSELHFGAEHSARPEQNFAVIEIRPYDLLIAAHARSAGLTPVTNNSASGAFAVS